MDRFEAMSMLLTAVDGGRLSAAAREMRVPISTLSRKVAELEAFLGTKLLIRTTRNLTLTDAGISYVAAVRRILEERSRKPRGTLQVSFRRRGAHSSSQFSQWPTRFCVRAAWMSEKWPSPAQSI
jgi:DNA-binding transcriptional LysR family regulator